jgi:hypothetical protein
MFARISTRQTDAREYPMRARRLWVTLLAHFLIISGLAIGGQVFHLVGWPIALGFTLGAVYLFCVFKWHYGWWPDFNMDGEDEKNTRLPRIDPKRTNWRQGAP